MPIGYRKLPCSDPKEQALRDAWYAAKEEAALHPLDPSYEGRVAAANRALGNYIWARVEAEITEDRRRHPKAKRNLPVGAESSGGGGRHLP